LKLLKHILFGNFWSFLLILSGIVDIGIGILILTGVIQAEDSTFTLFLVCLIIGLVYLAAGLLIAILKSSKQTDR
jgi:hypothetical protein